MSLLLVLGGARSGKSAYAEHRVRATAGDEVLYLATMRGGDPAMDARIAAHRLRRPRAWTTVSVAAGADVVAAMRRGGRHGAILLDGFELLLALVDPASDRDAEQLAQAAALACRSSGAPLACIVSAEAGLGVVPSTAEGGRFRDRLGAANQVLAGLADEVVLVVAGLPLPLKGRGA